MGHTVVCSIRNEGPYIVEWVSWYRMLGFSEILILTNDCTDHSPELLDLLEDHGLVTHVRVSIPADRQPTPHKLREARQHPLVTEATWTFLCDIDEFLVIHKGTLSDILPPGDTDILGVSFNWRVFGTGGQATWQDGLTHRQFLRSGGPDHPTGRWVKSAFRHAKWFRRMGVHAPIRLKNAKALDKWQSGAFRWISPSGRPLRSFEPGIQPYRMTERDEVETAVAQLNHYMMRSAESFALKQGTLSPVSGKDRYGKRFIRNFDRNEVEDDSAMIHRAAFDAVHAKVSALPGVARLHHLCCADYVARLAAKAGADPQADERWHYHMART